MRCCVHLITQPQTSWSWMRSLETILSRYPCSYSISYSGVLNISKEGDSTTSVWVLLPLFSENILIFIFPNIYPLGVKKKCSIAIKISITSKKNYRLLAMNYILSMLSCIAELRYLNSELSTLQIVTNSVMNFGKYKDDICAYTLHML